MNFAKVEGDNVDFVLFMPPFRGPLVWSGSGGVNLTKLDRCIN